MRGVEDSSFRIERGSQDSNLESPVLETGALANWATAPRGRDRNGRRAVADLDAGGGI